MSNMTTSENFGEPENFESDPNIVEEYPDEPVEDNRPVSTNFEDAAKGLPTLEDTKGMSEAKSNLKGLTAKALKMREVLMAEEKVGFVIPLDPLEPKGAMESVIINGYGLYIKKGVFVRIPMSVAKLLADSHNITMETLSNHPTNLNNPESQLSPGFLKTHGGL